MIVIVPLSFTPEPGRGTLMQRVFVLTLPLFKGFEVPYSKLWDYVYTPSQNTHQKCGNVFVYFMAPMSNVPKINQQTNQVDSGHADLSLVEFLWNQARGFSARVATR